MMWAARYSGDRCLDVESGLVVMVGQSYLMYTGLGTRNKAGM